MITGSGPCSSFKRELFLALHNFASDEFRIALYTSDADLGVETTAYLSEGEVAGPGYEAGGQVLRNVQILGPVARASYVTWDDAKWPQSSLVARGALIYNQSSGQRAVAVMDFLANQVSNTGEFWVKFPPAGPGTALIRLL